MGIIRNIHVRSTCRICVIRANGHVNERAVIQNEERRCAGHEDVRPEVKFVELSILRARNRLFVEIYNVIDRGMMSPHSPRLTNAHFQVRGAGPRCTSKNTKLSTEQRERLVDVQWVEFSTCRYDREERVLSSSSRVAGVVYVYLCNPVPVSRVFRFPTRTGGCGLSLLPVDSVTAKYVVHTLGLNQP